MVIRADERVADVLRRDEHLVEVFAAAAPAFERLRNPLMRRTMARLVTVEQAARIGGLEPEALLSRLNAALGDAEASPSAAQTPPEAVWASDRADAMPPALRAWAAADIVDLDVRDDLRNGIEPFSRIMSARRALAPGQLLRLRAIFEPVPLYAVMAKQGLEHWTERLADDDWRVWFYEREEDAAPGAAAEAASTSALADDLATGVREAGAGEVVVLDVRGLEPPEPMARTLAALETLPDGATLVQINVRVPQFLLPQLEAQGFTWEIREQTDELVRLFIRRR